MSNSFITCRLCKREFKAIIGFHLKFKHGTTMAQYRAAFPDAPLTSEESRQKNREAKSGEKNHNFGKHLSDEHKRKISEGKKGVPRTEETRAKISAALSGEKNPFFGRTHSAETKRKISEAQLGEKGHMFGKRHTSESRRKISETRKERFRSGRIKLSPLAGWGHGGFFEDLGKHMRCMWEANVARILIHENIPYQYEPERFYLIPHSDFSYLPDFHLPALDLWIEVKGYMDEEDRLQINIFEENRDLLVIDKEKYYELEKKYKNVIENWGGQAIKEEIR